MLCLYRFLDFIIGKIGWLSIFTAPEDFNTAVERAPRWLSAMLEAMREYLLWAAIAANKVLSWATSYEALLIVLAVIVLCLVIDIDSFRRKVSVVAFKMRSAVKDIVWISEKAAIEIVLESEWGRIRSPYVTYGVTLLDLTGLPASVFKPREQHGMSEKDKSLLKFRIYVRKILESFAASNPDCVRLGESGREFDEGAVRRLVEKMLDEEITREFGSMPSTDV